jgi:hypothetical protein
MISMNRTKTDIIEFLVFFLFFFVAVTAIHEEIHLLTMQALGGDGYILIEQFSGAVKITHLPTYAGIYSNLIVNASAGLTLGTILIYFAYNNWKETDYEEFTVYFAIGMMQLSYGVFETIFNDYTMPISLYYNYAQIPFTVGLLLGFLMPLPWKNGFQIGKHKLYPIVFILADHFCLDNNETK